MIMQKPAIYLDYNATTPLKPHALAAMQEALQLPYNASSTHHYGRKAKALLEKSRKNVLASLGAEGAYAVFVSGGTEANNLALRALPQMSQLLVSAIEHASVLTPAKALGARIIPVDQNGIIRLDVLENMLAELPGKALVSVMLANNETGVIQPITEIVRIVLAAGGFTHCDAVQAYGKIPVDFHALNVDMLTVSSHKIGGPLGAGALIIKRGLAITPLLVGGGQEQGYRAGTENLPAISGFAEAVQHMELSTSHLRDILENTLLDMDSNIRIYGKSVSRLPNTACIRMNHVENHTQLIHFDLHGIMVSSGAACSSGKIGHSHVLEAMGVAKQDAAQSIRVSIGEQTTEAEIQAFINAWESLYRQYALSAAA